MDITAHYTIFIQDRSTLRKIEPLLYIKTYLIEKNNHKCALHEASVH